MTSEELTPEAAAEWRTVPAGDVGRFRGGSGFPLRFQGQASGEVPFFKVSDMNLPGNGKYMTRANHYISEAVRKQLGATLFPAGSIVFAKVGAAVFLERKRILGQPSCIDNNMAALVLDPSRAHIDFVHQLLLTIRLGDLVSATALPALNGSDLASIPLSLPSTACQREVATVLERADALLGKLDQLIAKKRDLKQAAMQQLLSGEIRLPGFASQCRTVQLADLGAWVGGATPSMKNAAYWTDGDVPWISSGDVTQPLSISALRLITRRAVLETATKVLPAGSLVLVTRSGILRHTLPIALVPSPVSINQDIKGLIPKTGVFGPFVLQALLESAPRILGACLKAGTTVESIEFRWLKRFPIRLPEESEQRAIAEVLCDMDTELVALEASRNKTRQLKQGMMQALLTGRIRLT